MSLFVERIRCVLKIRIAVNKLVEKSKKEKNKNFSKFKLFYILQKR